jgi:hypothetical protein
VALKRRRKKKEFGRLQSNTQRRRPTPHPRLRYCLLVSQGPKRSNPGWESHFYMIFGGLCPFEISWCLLASDSSVSASCGFVEGRMAIALQERLSSRTRETGMIQQSCNAQVAPEIHRMHIRLDNMQVHDPSCHVLLAFLVYLAVVHSWNTRSFVKLSRAVHSCLSYLQAKCMTRKLGVYLVLSEKLCW